MDSFYNKMEARDLLERIAERRATAETIDVQLVFYQNDGGAGQTATPAFIDKPRSWKLVAPGSNASEELVLRIQGILCKEDLPPIKRPIKTHWDEQRYIKQTISLTGLGAQYFDACVNNITQINDTFSRTLPPGKMDTWFPSLFDGTPSIDIGSRYFSNQRETKEALIPFKSYVDPEKHLENALDNKWVHTAENEVEYLEYRITEGGGRRYNPIEPTKFRVSDIVEAQISFIVIPIRERRYKLINVLRAITLLDVTPTMDANSARRRNKIQETSPRVTLKRKIGYDDDEEKEARAKMMKLALL